MRLTLSLCDEYFKFNERSKSVNDIEMNAGILKEIQLTFLPDNGAHTASTFQQAVDNSALPQRENIVFRIPAPLFIAPKIIDELKRFSVDFSQFEPPTSNIIVGISLPKQSSPPGTNFPAYSFCTGK